MFGGNSVVMYCGYPVGPPAGAMTLSLTSYRLYLFPLTSETQLTLDVVVRMLCPIGNGFVQPPINTRGMYGESYVSRHLRTSDEGNGFLLIVQFFLFLDVHV